MNQNPEYKTLNAPAEFKVDVDSRTIEGYASVFKIKDLGGDIIHPGAFARSLSRRSKESGGWRIPLLWQHQIETPIGRPVVLEEDSYGLHFIDSIPDTGPGTPETRALVLAKEGVIDGVSIGYISEREEIVEKDDDWTRDLFQVDLFERSLVTFPMNDEARVTRVQKQWLSLDSEFCAKAGKLLSAKNFRGIKRAIDILEGVIASITLESEKSEHKAVIPYKSYPTDDRPWDGPAEIAAAEVSDLRIMCTWYDSENADVKSAYKLPHHRADGYSISWQGLTAAMGALLGARGGVQVPSGDRRGIYNHLARHYRDDFDRDPPEFRSVDSSEIETADNAFLESLVETKEAIDRMCETFKSC